MLKSAFTPFRRILVLAALALILPTVVLLVLEVSFTLREQRREVEAQALETATEVSNLVDGRLQADLSAMRVLATATSARNRDWSGFADRARQVAELNPGWRAVIVSDPDSGRQFVDTGRPDPATAAPIQTRYFKRGSTPPLIDGVYRDGASCPCVALNAPVIGDNPQLVMTVLVDTQVFRAILTTHDGGAPVTAIVDRDAHFVARNRAYAERVGGLASVFVQAAIKRGGEGVYQGTTLEGFHNYTGFHTSVLSGWSVHLAVAAAKVDRPQAWTNRVRIGGALLGLALALGLVALALNELVMRRREEESLRQTQKLEALGRLTGGVAHDFNNLLTVIIGALDMLSSRVDDPRSKRLAERALEAARRGARLTGQLLTFSRNQRLQVSPVDIAELIIGMDDLLRQSVGPDINLKIEINETPLWGSTDASQMEFAVLNLVLNARDAMPDGGDLLIRLGPGPAADLLSITVTDTGHGMERAVAERALEPFFSTKPADRGTGLGLAQVFGAVRQSGGDITIDSAPGRGTTIRLVLPRCSPAPAADEAARDPAVRQPNHASVLIVDDEDDVRATIAEALADAGYRADQAANGEEALIALRARPYDLVLTDFAMPGMTGVELAVKARALNPDQLVLIISGYADTEVIVAARLDIQVLLKPVDVKALTNAVAAALAL